MSSPLASSATVARVAARPRRRFRLEPGEWALLILFALVSLWVLGLDLYQVVFHGRVWTGTDGSYVADQLQYLAWIESASRHFLVANMYVLHGTPSDYFQPAVAISGLLVAIGMSPWLALLLWKPVGVISLFLAVRLFARRSLPQVGRGAWLAIIALTLFYGSFTTWDDKFTVLEDLFPGFMSWGYPFALMALAAIIFAFVIYAQARRERRVAWSPAVLGALASILHPWQGELMVVILGLVELFSPDTRSALSSVRSLRRLGAELATPRVRLAVLTLAGTLLPLLYYAALDKLDMSWALGRDASRHEMPALSILLVVAPIGLIALAGYRGAAPNFLYRICRVWPLAAAIVFVQSGSSAGATPLHTFFGITLPLAVLAVSGCLRLGWRRLRFRRALAVALILCFTLPTTYYEMKQAATNARPRTQNANFITRGDRDALRFMRTYPVPGGVLARFYIGAAVPALTGRHTYVGNCIWSEPDCRGRSALTSSLINASLTPAQTQAFVLSTHAHFVFADCGTRSGSPLIRKLGPVLESVHQFGCATVYVVQ